MNFNGETWLRTLILLYGLIVSVSCLRGSELILQLAKAKNAPTAPASNATEGEISDAEGRNSSVTGEKSLLTGIPQIDYIHDPNLPRELNGFNLSDYPFYNAVPSDIDFKCDGLHDGFYASVPHHCQVYHHCLYGIRYDFLCANYTAFDQKTFICHFVSEVDCNNSPKYYQRNEALYKQETTTAAPVIKTTTTKATTEAPTKKDQEVKRPGPFRHRRPPFRRRPSYDYYDNEEYYDDYYYYGPPVRKRPNRNKGFRGGDSYYGGDRAGGHKSIHRDGPRRKPAKPLYEDEDEEYEYYDDSADGARDDDDRRRPLDNNYRKPDRDRLYQNKKRDKDVYSRNSERNEKKKRIEDDYVARKNEDDKRLRNKYKSYNQRSKYERDEDENDDFEPSRRYQDDKREKYFKNKSTDSSKRVTESEKPLRSKFNQKYTTPLPDDEEYDDIVATPKFKSRFQQRRPFKEEPKKGGYSSYEDDDSNDRTNTERPKDSKKNKSTEVTEQAVPFFNPSLYARQPSKLYSQVKVETRPPATRNKDWYKADVPATTMSSLQTQNRRPSNSRLGSKDRASNDDRPKAVSKTTTTTSPPDLEYEYEDSLIDDTDPAKSYYEEEVSESYLTAQFPSKASPTIKQPPKTLREQQSRDETEVKNNQKSKSTQSSFSQRFKPVTERTTTPAPKPQTTEKPLINKPPVTDSQFLPYPKQPLEDAQTLSYFRQPVTEKQQFTYSKQPAVERQPQLTYQRQSYLERQPFVERQPLVERQPYSERQSFSEKQPYTERQPFTDRQPYNERQTYTDRQSYTERQPYTDRQTYTERQPYNDRQPLYPKQAVTERLNPYQKQPVTDRQVIAYVKQPVTDRQLIPFKQIVTERQIFPYLRQAEVERKPVPFPKQPPRTFEITAPGPSGLGGRIEVSDSIQRGKYVIQDSRPSGFSLRLPQTEYTSPLQPSQIQRRPEESNSDKIVTRSSFKPIRTYRAKPTPEPQYHDNVRLETFPQRYLTGTEEYEPVVLPNSRLPVIPQVSHVSSPKEWYW